MPNIVEKLLILTICPKVNLNMIYYCQAKIKNQSICKKSSFLFNKSKARKASIILPQTAVYNISKIFRLYKIAVNAKDSKIKLCIFVQIIYIYHYIAKMHKIGRQKILMP